MNTTYLETKERDSYDLHSTPSTLVGYLSARAQHQPETSAYIYLSDGELEEAKLSYSELDGKARTIAALLQTITAPNQRALLIYPPGLEFISAFFGCLYAGVIAVPAYPPHASHLERTFPRLQAIADDASPSVVLTTTPIMTKLEKLASHLPCLAKARWIATEELDRGMADEWREPDVTSDSIAFLQYTSGSTSKPKGVMVSHGNLLHNQRLIRQACQHTHESTFVGWLPLYHDMGLIGNVLQPLYLGALCVLMSPGAFLQKPFRWLQAISRYRGATSGGPNFAYDLCVRKISSEQRATLNLSSWTVAFNGAEPVRSETLKRFAETFAPCGFRKESFYPCYGLAEATLFVSGGLRTAPPLVNNFKASGLELNRVEMTSGDDEDARPLVGCGKSSPDQKIAVVNVDTLTLCPPDQVGEIWVSGASVAQGYWGRAEDTEKTFHAYLADTGEGPFLRTGDLGFLDKGELFVTGRLKDLIIIRGRNHYPQDIELTVEQCHPSLRPGCGAVFSIELEGEEQLVIVQEFEDKQQADPDSLIQLIRRRVSESHDVLAHAVVLIKAGTIPKTSSGKIQRHACQEKYLKAELETVKTWHSATGGESPAVDSIPTTHLKSTGEILDWLLSNSAAVLRVSPDQLDLTRPIAQYGLDSLAAAEFAYRIEEEFGMALPAATILQDVSISLLAAQIRKHLTEHPSDDSSVQTSDQNPLGEHPLSYGQRSLWFLNQLAPESPVYNIATAFRIQSHLDADCLQRALEALVERHASLRTTFSQSQDQPMQLVQPKLAVRLQHIDAAGWEEELLKKRLGEEAARLFDLNKGPLMRATLYKKSDSSYVLQWVLHHIIADLWSLGVLMQEFWEIYRAERNGGTASLPQSSVDYISYSRWQAQMLAGTEGERLWDYWRKQLGGELPVLNLPTDKPRPPIQTFNGASEPFQLDRRLTDKLKSLSREQGATLYMTLLACFFTLLHRYTQQDDILLGTPTNGRDRADLKGLVGYLVNPVPVRADFSSEPTFEEFLAQVRRTVLEAMAHQAYPLALLAERLQPERDPSRSPLFQSMLVFQKSHLLSENESDAFTLGQETATLQLGGLRMESMAVPQQVAQFDLMLTMTESTNGLSASLQYNTDLFERDTVVRMTEHFQSLVESIVAAPHARVSELSLLDGVERKRLLFEWNETKSTFPETAFVHRLIEAQAASTPGAIALAFEGTQLTYAEVNERANRLGNYLRSLGVGPETLVGIFMERSLEMVLAILGTLKAGAAYVPLDPSYPQERLTLMLDDSRPTVVLTQGGLRTSLPDCEAQTVCLDTDWRIIAAYDGDNPVVDLKPDNLAYVIYTSGSTGQPKGAMNTHAGIANRLLWMQRAYGLGAGDSVLQKTPFTFDVSVWEFLWPLMAGARLVVARPGGHQDSAYLVGIINEQQITTIHFVPSMLQAFLSEEGVESCRSLKRVICSGEALSTPLQARFFERLEAELHNLYGPTEAAIDVTYWACRRDDERRSVPIGRPIANTQVYLLDKNLQPVPAGIGGELHIGGINLARGYLGQPALTAEKFIPHPFSSEAGQRLYKTGDLARYRADGAIEFLGRIDHQVKIRGVRIEVEEIETQLSRHPMVKDAVVVAGEAASGDKRLVAYVVGRPEATLTASDLRQFLKQRLPDAMVPAVFVVLDELPLHPNGKVNRRALPEPEGQRPELDKAYIAPRSEVEQKLSDIWRHLLGVELVGINDDFFELGGHSLLVTQLISRIRAAFNISLPLATVFKTPTVAALAERIEHSLQAGAGGAGQPAGNGHASAGNGKATAFAELLSGDGEACRHQPEISIALPELQRDINFSIPPLKAMTREKTASLSFAQQRLWFLDQLAPGSPDYNMPGVVRLTGELNVGALEKTLNEIVRRHEILRTTFSSEGGHPVQVIHDNLTLNLPLTDLREHPASEIYAEQIIAEETRRPFDLTTGPLMRAKLLRLGEQSHLLLLVLHHIVCDGWSKGLLLREISELYAAFSKQAASPLTEPAIQYADYALWQRSWLQGEMLDEQLNYWRRQLGGTLPVLELPADHPRATAHETKGEVYPFTLPEDLRAAINTLSMRQGATLFMTLLAAFKVLLYRYTGQTDVILGSPIANRNRMEVESLIGFFVNTLVLRTDLAGDPTFVTLLDRVKQTALDAYQHQDLPFEKLVEEIQPNREIDQNALFQVMFILQNAPASTLSMPGLTAEPLDVGNGASIFDLTLYVEESPQGLKCAIEYKSALFERATISRMAEHFAVLLRSIVTDPSQRISSIPLLGAAERQQILYDFNRVAAAPFVNACIHHLIEHQAAQRPDALAVVDNHEQLTYQELNSRANQLARRLQSVGVGPDTLVGLCLNRSAQMLVGLLAILKAGGAYVPLDPSYPRERLALMLRDAGLTVLLTEKALESLFTDGPAKILCLDRDQSPLAQESSHNVESAVQPQHLAYVIYTSGSTGKPKGVMIPHRALVDHCLNVMKHYGMRPEDKVLQVASISFDVAAEEIFPTWLSGATVVMPGEKVLASSSNFAGLLEEHQITLTNISATHWSELVNELHATGSSIAGSMRLMITGVEKVPVERLALWQEVGGAAIPFINTYGPTEATIGATMYQLDEEDQRRKNWSWVPIGKPVGTTHIFILDEHLKPVPIGVVGEIYIGGERLARGYLGHPDVTAEKFIPDPFSRIGGERLYRTGDLGRYLNDGNIEFSGRIDQQVKIRGYRVELGEIEAALMQHESVAECVVLAREDAPGDKRLVAYVVPNLQYLQSGDGALGKDLVPEHVSQWESVFDDLFDKIIEDDEQKATFYVKGWNSSYTDEQIPEEEIREWTNNTVNRILDLRPKRVLEIGSGSGLMLFRIGPHCEQYCATDLAENFIPMLEKQLAVLDEQIPGVSLMQRAADDFSDLREDSFDAVLISSVVQYFPSIEYLMQVLEGAVRLVEPGGFVFVGDVRNLALLEAFHASVQLYRAAAGLSVDELRRRVKRQMRSERQLVIDPTFFMTLHKRLNKVREVEVQLLRGRHHNEEIKYRYDVIIHVGSSRTQTAELRWLDWEQENLGLESLRQRLAGERPERLGVGGVPNARLLEDLMILDWLDKDQPATASDIRHAIQESDKSGIEPEDFWMIGEELGYDVDVTWADTGAEGRFDAVFTRRETGLSRSSRTFYSRLPRIEKPLREYANDPLKTKYEAGLQNEFAPKVVPELRSHLRERLPDYMLPSAFVIMDGLPVTANGKIDRQALPAPDKKRPELEQEYKTPRNEVEKTLARIWSEVLGVERVGIDDNFFDLGGHSLLAIQIMSRVSAAYNADVPLRSLFEEPTVAGLAKVVEQHRCEQEMPQPPSPPKLSKLADSLEQQLANLMQLSDEQVSSQLAEEQQATPRRRMK